jgi:transcriptional regulator with XRE-family HTH domain
MGQVSQDNDWDPRMRQLGGYIRLQRQMADLSLRRLADMTQVSNAYLSQIERGLHQPSIRVLRSIAQALNVSADTLLAQAGLLDPADPEAEARDTRSAVEAAIRADGGLTGEEQQALIRIYRSFRRDSPDDGAGTPSDG